MLTSSPTRGENAIWGCSHSTHLVPLRFLPVGGGGALTLAFFPPHGQEIRPGRKEATTARAFSGGPFVDFLGLCEALALGFRFVSGWRSGASGVSDPRQTGEGDESGVG